MSEMKEVGQEKIEKTQKELEALTSEALERGRSDEKGHRPALRWLRLRQVALGVVSAGIAALLVWLCVSIGAFRPTEHWGVWIRDVFLAAGIWAFAVASLCLLIGRLDWMDRILGSRRR